jgi:glycosyltransferase involved in cell wall biosynthesis
MIAYQNDNKNVSFFSKVADEAFEQKLPYIFLWAGGQGGDTSTLYHSPHVKWLGDQDQVMEIINQVDVFLFTSKADSFPLVFAEVLFKGKRIVSYTENGFASHIAGINGCRLYDNFDGSTVLALIKQVLQETPDAARQKQLAIDLCSLENFEKRLNDLSAL